jgi:hypothetical protein
MTMQVARGMLFSELSGDFWKEQVCGKTLLSAIKCSEKMQVTNELWKVVEVW